MDDHKYEFITKLLFVAFLFALFILVPAVWASKADSAYSTGDTTASASSSHVIRLVILPAIEHVVLEARQVDAENSTYLLGIRANTSWGLQYSVESSGSAYDPFCSASRTSGSRNLDESFQLVRIDCQSPLSWGDNSQVVQTLNYSVSATMSS